MADLGDGQGFWQPPASSGRLDNQRRIISAAPVGNEKPVELADRGKFSCARRGFETAFCNQGEISANVAGRGVLRRLSRAGEFSGIIGEVAGIGIERVFRSTAFGRDHLEKGFDQARNASRHRPAAPYLFSRAGGSDWLISRGCGSTNVTSAIMPP